MNKKNSSKVMFIIYVKDQEKARQFYQNVLQREPTLDVPGMTEFELSENTFLGIMPGEGIVKILENKINNPNNIKDMPRCELYLYVSNPDEHYERTIEAGGQGISKGQWRNWGDYVSYCMDLDGNVIAFASK